ncbi:MAG: class 3 adenylate cyclase/tetratricopeptide (TPR) repeat protein [Crocinitomicaceae bacterium]
MRILLFITVLFISGAGFAQEMRIDISETTKEFVDKFNTEAERHTDKDSIYFYFNRAVVIAQEIDYIEGEERAYKGLIELYKNDEKIYEKLRYNLLLSRLYEEHGTNIQKADGFEALGKLYFNEGLFSKSWEIFKRAANLRNLDLTRKYTANIWLARCQLNANEIDEALLTTTKIEFEKNLTTYQKIELQKEKAGIYHQLRAYDEELKSYGIILSLIENTEYQYLEPATFNNIGYANKYIGKNGLAKLAFYKSIQSAGNTDNAMLGDANFNLGLIYHNVKNIDSALACFIKAERFYLSAKDYASFADALNMQAMSYYHVDKQFSAQNILKRAFIVEDEHNLAKQKARSYEILTYVHQDLFEFELALQSHLDYLSIRDSLLTEERSKESRLLFDQYQIEQIEKQLRLIWSKNEMDVVNLARAKAEKEAERERFKSKEKEDELRIKALENDELIARDRLQKLLLIEERLAVENKEKELALIQRDNELKELALEKERLIVSENEKKIILLAREKELIEQKRLNGEQGFRNKLNLFIGAFLFILLILIGILIAYRQLRRRKKQIEAQSLIIAQSKLAIEAEKEISESLLLNILPFKVAEELKANGASKPKFYDEVSVGFTDFSGFTMISEKLSPEELVAKLDEIFLEFDRIIEDHGLQRIKTIGDAYMFAAGLPDPLDDHANIIVRASIELRNFIDRYNSELPKDDPKWNVRIGINTGPVVAGVIGIKKFAYDIWGDTVNTAARMESSGQIGKVNISGGTYKFVKDNFATEHRGKVAAKNKGQVEMYFVEYK